MKGFRLTRHLLLAAVLAGCSKAPAPAPEKALQAVVQQYLQDRVDANSNGCIKLVSCRQTHEPVQEVDRVLFYGVEYTATIEFLTDCGWDRSTEFHTDYLHFKGVHLPETGDMLLGGPDGAHTGMYPFHAGEQATLTGKVVVQHTPTGWVIGFNPVELPKPGTPRATEVP